MVVVIFRDGIQYSVQDTVLKSVEEFKNSFFTKGDNLSFFNLNDLQKSKYNVWKLKDDADPTNITSDDIEVDTQRELEIEKNLKKDEIKKAKKDNQNEDIEYKGRLFLGGIEQVDKYQKSRDLAVALGLTEGDFFDKDNRPVKVTLDEANELLKNLGTKIYKCKAQESALYIQIDEATNIEEVEAIKWVHVDL